LYVEIYTQVEIVKPMALAKLDIYYLSL